jgi:hypothetical protein
MKQRKPLSQPGLGLSLLDDTGAKSRRFCMKKAKEAAKKTLAKAQDSKSEAKEDKEAAKVNGKLAS